ncbi:hypothetical protein [Rhizobium sp. CECT 9324]|uniref:hypothetical protein n=1 Tax=Rhizobium sp. CECT 9324 TaxID=2845820 RepID=UPI001E44E7FD|nr:hypothetical protein [Rhizobium sp. CECT 9324]CAH0338939.1 hypothetical protein RHI9324_00574 [Rhizobium sp. CECT 9324]
MANEKTDLQKAIGSPVLAEASDDLRRTKRNLLLFASVSLFAKLAGIRITEASFLGFKFNNPEQIWLEAAMLSIAAYLFIKFAWLTVEYLQETRVRITGTALSHVTTAVLASHHGDYPSNPRQSTLYYWWTTQADKIGDFESAVNKLEAACSEIQELAARPGNIDQPNIQQMTKAATEARAAASNLAGRIQSAQTALQAERIPASLGRFDKWFRCFERVQAWRIIVMDIILPTGLALTSIVWTGMSLYGIAPPDTMLSPRG